jgi:hypothetical protein
MTKARIITVGVAAVAALLVVAGSASAKDRNRDRIPDKWEKKFHLSLKVNQANKDQDRDKVDNLNEFQEGTNPRRKDTDRDGRPDGREDADHDGLNNMNEDASANLPDDPDTDNDGVEDGDEVVGTIAGFDGTVLTIDLLAGGSVSGTVTADTRIKCETENEQEAEDETNDVARTSDDGSGDSSGEDQSGDANEGPGGDDEHLCTTADLTAGTMVHEAELEGDVFEEVDLIK